MQNFLQFDENFSLQIRSFNSQIFFEKNSRNFVYIQNSFILTYFFHRKFKITILTLEFYILKKSPKNRETLFTFQLDSADLPSFWRIFFWIGFFIKKWQFLSVFKHFFTLRIFCWIEAWLIVSNVAFLISPLQAIIMVLPNPPRTQCRRVLKVPQDPIATCMAVVSATWISLVLIPARRGNVDEIAQMWKPWRPSTHKMTLNHRVKTKTQKRNPVKTLTKVSPLRINYCIFTAKPFYLLRYFFCSPAFDTKCTTFASGI